MKTLAQTSFLREIGIGLLLSIVAATATSVMLPLMGSQTALRAVIAAAAFVSVCLSLGRAQEKTGRFVLLALCLCVTAAGWLSGVGLAGYVAMHVAVLWLTRSLYAHSTVTEAAIDLGLTIVSIGFAAWAAVRTDSLLLACWSFFLVQALHVYIRRFASRLLPAAGPAQGDDDSNRRFSDASRVADEALRRIAAR
jgi:hypothetical protein